MIILPITNKIVSPTESSAIFPSTMSLVVPSMSVTIAFSSSSNLFNKDDFPTLGFPIMPTFIPSFISLPFSLSSKIFVRASFISIMFLILFSIY